MIAMMIFIHLVILLTIGFGVGYWILITANKQEGRLKTIGESLGFVLIALVILSAIFGFIYSMNIDDRDYMTGVGQQKMQMLDKKEDEEIQNDEKNPKIDDERSEENGEMQDESQENENKPIKSNIKDHE